MIDLNTLTVEEEKIYSRDRFLKDEDYRYKDDVPGSHLHKHYKPTFYRNIKRNSLRPEKLHDTSLFYNDDILGHIITSREKIQNYIKYGHKIDILLRLYKLYKDSFDVIDKCILIENINLPLNYCNELFKDETDSDILNALAKRQEKPAGLEIKDRYMYLDNELVDDSMIRFHGDARPFIIHKENDEGYQINIDIFNYFNVGNFLEKDKNGFLVTEDEGVWFLGERIDKEVRRTDDKIEIKDANGDWVFLTDADEIGIFDSTSNRFYITSNENFNEVEGLVTTYYPWLGNGHEVVVYYGYIIGGSVFKYINSKYEKPVIDENLVIENRYIKYKDRSIDSYIGGIFANINDVNVELDASGKGFKLNIFDNLDVENSLPNEKSGFLVTEDEGVWFLGERIDKEVRAREENGFTLIEYKDIDGTFKSLMFEDYYRVVEDIEDIASQLFQCTVSNNRLFTKTPYLKGVETLTTEIPIHNCDRHGNVLSMKDKNLIIYKGYLLGGSFFEYLSDDTLEKPHTSHVLEK